jgi:hypothetical protein
MIGLSIRFETGVPAISYEEDAMLHVCPSNSAHRILYDGPTGADPFLIIQVSRSPDFLWSPSPRIYVTPSDFQRWHYYCDEEELVVPPESARRSSRISPERMSGASTWSAKSSGVALFLLSLEEQTISFDRSQRRDLILKEGGLYWVEMHSNNTATGLPLLTVSEEAAELSYPEPRTWTLTTVERMGSAELRVR